MDEVADRRGKALLFWTLLLLAAAVPTIIFDAQVDPSGAGFAVALTQALMLACGAGVIYAVRRRKRTKSEARKYLVVGVALVAVFIGQGRLYGSKRDAEELRSQPAVSAATAQPAAPPEMTVLVSRQDGQGAVEANMDAGFLKNLEAYIAQRTKELGDKAVAEGRALPEDTASRSSVYIEAEGKRLAVLRSVGTLGHESAIVAGFVGAEFVRVLCVRRDGSRVPLAAGPCHDKVKEVFGVGIGS